MLRRGVLTLLAFAACDAGAPDLDPAPRVGCAGWTAVTMPELSLVDVAVRGADDVWLLTNRGVYRYDGCTWRAHQPFEDLSGTIMDWQTIVVDPDGALVVTGESPEGPRITTGCTPHAPCCHVGPEYPAKQRSYRYVPGQTQWTEIAGRPHANPDLDVANTNLDDERSIVATSDSYAVVKRTHPFPVQLGNHDVGYGTVTSTELWHRDQTWAPLLVPPAIPPTTDIKPDRTNIPDDVSIAARGRSGPTDQWAVGFDSTAMPVILHFDGSAWTRYPHQRLPRNMQYHLTGVTSTGPDDAWVIGEWGVVLHWDGTQWAELDKPSFNALQSISVIADKVWVHDAAGGVFTRSARVDTSRSAR